ncbi:MAG: GtrA family protein [Actinobacteria bacterium]|nr:MAG: GtrA family protein [Actinomycetota bacterium]
MKKLIKNHEQKIKYLFVGGWNTIFSFAVFSFFYFAFHKVVHYIVILVVNYIIGITNAYICYKIFVFKTKGNYLKEYLKFYVVYGMAFAINAVTLPFAVEILKLSPIIAQAGIVLITVCISYTGHKHFSFSAPENLNI